MLESRWVVRALVVITVGGLVGGLLAQLAGAPQVAEVLWIVATAAALVPILVDTIRDLLRGQAGVDVIAILALVGAFAFGEYLAGAVIGVMLATGAALEDYAAGRAERELTALIQRAPRIAHRVEGATVVDVPVEQIAVGDRLLVKEADAIPVDGVLASDSAVLDESALTGESRLVEHETGDQILSGTVNAGGTFEMHASTTADASTYAGIVRLVRAAQDTKSPFVRLADRYAAYFVPVTLAVAGGAWWLSGDSQRAFAVLVVATPCPLLLAAPIAIVSGISRAAKRGIIVRDGGALETLARAQRLLLDKTGTLTMGTPRVSDVVATHGGDATEVLQLAASLDQVSSHVLAAAVVRAAQHRGLTLEFPGESREVAGGGVEGTVGGRRVAVGSTRWIHERTTTADASLLARVARHGGSHAVVAVDGNVAGAVLLEDPIRPDTPRTIRELKRLGIEAITMLTGDRSQTAESVGLALGIDRVLSEQSPESKVQAVADAGAGGAVTAMVGDGVNDAAALATADVGIAMGARGATASSEAADIVIAVDRLDRLVEAIRIAQRTRRIASQSVLIGMSLSFGAMAVAALGLLPPIGGAMSQEAIDVVAILWALRALAPGERRLRAGSLSPQDLRVLLHENRAMDACVEQLRTTADLIDARHPGESRARLGEVADLLKDTLLPHEQDDESTVYPMLAQALPGPDPLASLSRTHQELFLQARTIEAYIRHLDPAGPSEDDVRELRRRLYGLYALFRLHNAEEEEIYDHLADD